MKTVHTQCYYRKMLEKETTTMVYTAYTMVYTAYAMVYTAYDQANGKTLFLF